MPATFHHTELNKNTINVVFATDNDYLIPTYVAVFSMLVNYCGERELHIYLMVPNDYSEENKVILTRLAKGYPLASLTILDMGDAFSTMRMNLSYVGFPTMYRLLLPQILKNFDKCLYLDSDLVVEGSIDELYDENIEQYYVAGVRNFDDNGETWRERLSIPSVDRYINAGVLLLNLYEIRKDHLEKRLEEAGKNEAYLLNDQDAINVVLYEKIKIIPLKFNARSSFIDPGDKALCSCFGKSNILDAKRQPLIVHYIGNRKPWNYQKTYDGRYWRKYTDMLPSSFKEKYLYPYLIEHSKENEHTISGRLSEYWKEMLKRIGVYFVIRRFLYKSLVLLKSKNQKRHK